MATNIQSSTVVEAAGSPTESATTVESPEVILPFLITIFSWIVPPAEIVRAILGSVEMSCDPRAHPCLAVLSGKNQVHYVCD